MEQKSAGTSIKAWAKDRWLRGLATYQLAYLALVFLIIGGWAAIEPGVYRSMMHWPKTGGPDWRSHLAVWDVPHYLRLSETGYELGAASNAFYPLWPAVIRSFSILTGGEVFYAAFFLANLFAILGLWLLHGLVKETHGEQMARNTLWLYLAFPGAMFFHVPYTESIFLCLLMGFFLSLQKRYYWGVILTGILLPLTKAIGVFCLAPLVWHLIEHRSRLRAYTICLFPLFGYGLYFLALYWATGNPLEGMKAQKYYPYNPSLGNILTLAESWKVFWQVDSLHDPTTSALDRFFFMVFLVTLPGVWRLNRTWFWFALLAGLVPALTNRFFSYTRYIMACFPVFVALAALLQDRRWLWWIWLMVAFGLQLFILNEYLHYRWAG